jgi:hypothetical protein
VPLNIASYALLTHMIAQQCDLEPGEFVWTGGDCHTYANHFEQVKTQLAREPRPWPRLVIRRRPPSIFDYGYEDFVIEGYEPHPAIKAPVAVWAGRWRRASRWPVEAHADRLDGGRPRHRARRRAAAARPRGHAPLPRDHERPCAGPLTAKLAKRYWQRPNVQGRPLVIAIQDFHAPMSMTMSRTALPVYLYGYVHDWEHQPDGKLLITPRKVTAHRWGNKEIPSGFFGLPESENISAVIANTSATISKFNRTGVVAGFGSKRVRLLRRGLVTDLDPNASMPKPFVAEVNAPGYSESWIEGMDSYHNPRARNALHPDMLPGAAHHFIEQDGQLRSFVPDWQPLSSTTHILVPKP